MSVSGGWRRHCTRADLASLIATCLFFLTWTRRAEGRIHLAEALAQFAIVLVSFVSGRVFLAAIGGARLVDRSFPLVFLSGSLLFGLVTTLLHMATDLGLVRSFALYSLVAAAGYVTLRKRIGDWSASTRAERLGFWATLTSLVATTFWMQHIFPQRVDTATMSRFRVFDDAFAYTVNAMALVTPGNPFRSGSFHFAGEGLSFYHWASYSYAALVHLLGDQPLVATMASVWYPFGFYLFGLAAFVLARTFYGLGAANLAVLAVMVVPDPTYWSSDIVLFSYDRLIEASPGMAYASAAAALALVLVTVGLRGHGRGCLLAGILTTFLAFLFKVNIIVTVLPATLFVLILEGTRTGRRQWLAWTAGFLLGVGALWWFASHLRSAPTVALDPDFGESFTLYVAPWIKHGSLLLPLADMAEGPSSPGIAPVRAAFILLATFQWLVPLFALTVIALAVIRGRVSRFALFVAVSLLFYAAFGVLMAPNENGDRYELQHRVFCWYYLLLAIGLAGEARRLFLWCFARTPVGRAAREYGYAFATLLLILPLIVGRTMYMPIPQMTFARGFTAAAEYLRDHSEPSAAIVDSIGDPWLATTALTRRAIYTCYDPSFQFPGSTTFQALRAERREQSAELFAARTRDAIRAWSDRHNIRWSLVHPQSETNWPADFLARPAFASMGYRVYDLQAAQAESASKPGPKGEERP